MMDKQIKILVGVMAGITVPGVIGGVYYAYWKEKRSKILSDLRVLERYSNSEVHYNNFIKKWGMTPEEAQRRYLITDEEI